MRLFFAVLIGAFLLPASVLAAPPESEQMTAYQVVEKGVAAITQALEAEQEQFEQQPERLYQAVSEAMEPYVDFRYISARVMGGRYFRAATPQQRSRFAVVFQETLVKTFAQGLIGFDYQAFDLQFQDTPSRHEDQESVPLDVVAENGQRYPVVFTLRYNKERWQVINVIVNGVNLGLTFNSQFDRAMREHQRDFDRVIANWSPDAAVKDIQSEAN